MKGKKLNLSERNKNIVIRSAILIVCLVLTFIVFKVAINSDKKIKSINYKVNSNVDYKVNLKDNKFFNEEDSKKNQKFVASLINNVDVNYDYELIVDNKNYDYSYSYLIEMEVDVKEPGNDKTIYHKVEKLKDKEETKYNSGDNLKINEKINFDYNHYNDIIKEFVSTYGLTDIECTLEANMRILLKDEDESTPNETILTVSLPLTTKTVDVNVKSNVIEVSDNKFVMKVNSTKENIFIAIGCLLGIVDLALIAFLVKYILDTRSTKAFYESELNKILNNYDSYIQKVDSIDEKGSNEGINTIELESFTDMLEIRDNLNSPILMFQDPNNTFTQFKILDITNKVVYIFTLKNN